MNTPNTPGPSSLSEFLKRRAIFFKMAGVTLLLLLLLIPLGMIQSVLHERLDLPVDLFPDAGFGCLDLTAELPA